jgi:ABC-type branched-subunit amino acid transport system ATPase component
MAKHIADRCHQGAAFLVVEQNLSFLMQVMHQVKVLDHGETVLSGRDLHRDQMEKHLKV